MNYSIYLPYIDYKIIKLIAIISFYLFHFLILCISFLTFLNIVVEFSVTFLHYFFMIKNIALNKMLFYLHVY
jgi:hypothetical protein